MPYLEYYQENEILYWEVIRQGSRVIKRSGKIGEYTPSTFRVYGSKETAQAVINTLVEKKIEEGWEIVTDSISHDLPEHISLPVNKDLEKILYNAIEDDEAWLVYGDWLQTQNDPRGEIIVLNHAKKTKAIQEQIQQLQSHYLAWVGNSLAKYFLYQGLQHETKDNYILNLKWNNGFIQQATIEVEHENGWSLKAFADLTYQLLISPAAKFMQFLHIRDWNYYPARIDPEEHHTSSNYHYSKSEILVNTLEKHSHPSLRYLKINLPSCKLYNINYLNINFPRLTHAELQAQDLSLHLHHEQLTHLSLQTNSYPSKIYKALIDIKLPLLQELSIFWYQEEIHANFTEDYHFLIKLLNGACPNLCYLHLHGMVSTMKIIDLLTKASITPQLKIIDLSFNDLKDHDIENVKKIAPSLQHLQYFCLEGADMTMINKNTIKSFFPKKVLTFSRKKIKKE